MGWAVAAPIIGGIAGSIIGAVGNSKTQGKVADIQSGATQAALAEQKRIFDLQRQDELEARRRRLAVAGNNRQVLMGDNGKMTLGAPNNTLADYGDGVYTGNGGGVSHTQPVGGGTSLGDYGGAGMGVDGQRQGPSTSLSQFQPSDTARPIAAGVAQMAIKNYQTGETKMISPDDFPQYEAAGWVMSLPGA